MMDPEAASSTAYVVDSDPSQHSTYETIFEHARVVPVYFSKPSELLGLENFARPGCIVCDLEVGDVQLDRLQQQLFERAVHLPVIFVGSDPGFSTAVRLMERGAFTVMRKPLSPDSLIPYLDAALRQDLQQLKFDRLHDSVSHTLAKMTERQRTVLEHIVQGLSTKSIAFELGVSQRLIEKERSKILELFSAASTPDVTLKLGEFRVLRDLRTRIDAPRSTILRTSVHRNRTGAADREH